MSDETSDRPLRELRFEYTPRLPEILTHLNSSLLITTYQAGKLVLIGAHRGQLSISFVDYDRPMGLAVSRTRIAVGSRKQVHFLVPAHETQSSESNFDGCFVPRSSFHTGSIQSHDLAWGQDGLWIANTLFSCLSTLHDDFSFIPQWRPPFVSQLADEDRCHLNGLAIDQGQPRYVTALGATNTTQGWRANKATGGVVIEVPGGHTVCRGLSMPHSPRVHGGRLWLLDSGRGTFGWVDAHAQQYHVVEAMPGYTRGLAFDGQFAFVGLSKIRDTSVFDGVPIAEERAGLHCGIAVVDLTTGRTVAVFKFLSGVSEIFAIEVLKGFCHPLISGAAINGEEREVWIVPNEDMVRPKPTSRAPIFASETAGHSASPAAPGAGSVGELIQAAVNFHSQGQSELAAHAYEAAIAAHPTPAPLLVDLGNLRQDQDKQAAARLCYERALALDPNCVAALQNLGYLLFNMGEAEKAHDIYERLIELDPVPLNLLLASSVLPVIYDSQADIEYWRQRQLAYLDKLLQRSQKVDATQSLVPTAFFSAYQGLCDREVMEKRGRIIVGRDYTQGQCCREAQCGIRSIVR